MITTLSPILIETSYILNEGTTDTTAKRISFGNRAIRRVLQVRKWSWGKKDHTLTVIEGTQEYNLVDEISNYNPMWGVYEVYVGGEKIDPVEYSRRNDSSGNHFYIVPDTQTIGFTMDIDGTEDIVIWYYASWNNVSTTSENFDLTIPEQMLDAICLLIKSYVHDAKRQRYDARNALTDYKESIEELVLQDASNKAHDLPQVIPNVMEYHRARRTYSY